MNITTWREKKKFVTVDGQEMAYIEMGTGNPIVFQHGNPTSSYLWRNILPKLSAFGRCIALDLIGMGNSDKLADSGPTRYTLAEHRHFWDGALSALGIRDKVTFVVHDWGTALGFDWCRRHPGAVDAVCHMEGIVKRLAWEDFPAAATDIFRTFRSPAGEEAVLQNNVFIEGILPSAMLRKLTEEEMGAYRAPFVNPGEDRRPMLTWPRQIPLANEPVDVCENVDAYGAYMQGADFSKLMIAGDPGMIMNGSAGAFARSWKNQEVVTVRGVHYLQEDSPTEIADAIATWLKKIRHS
ncbi:MAG: haloalkane dehalogenase [Gammaproteobacteria bacterium]